jgi:hypothetical protein
MNPPARRTFPDPRRARMTDDARKDDLPQRDQNEIDREAEKNRKELDQVPEHGTDPLHEGP